MKKKNKLTGDDKKVWEAVKKTVTPIGEPEPTDNPPKLIDFSDVLEAVRNFKPFTASKPQRTLDLHGMTRNEAYQYLEVQLLICKLRGYKCVEIITGRGHGKGEGLGILKRKVPLWMEGVKFKSIVKSWKQVPGNDGAIYVYLKA